MADMVNNPPHYQDASGIECIEVTKYMGFCDGNSFKYLYRAGKKGDEIEDLCTVWWTVLGTPLFITSTRSLQTRRNKCNTHNENTQSSLRQVHLNG